ncbi:uncharacterized protein Dana_GF26873 [Drosophila ananassae]|uniref:C-type lectin domain-containing protein n=1 Tax=Drosophila ananassae TaxID=7217 RepID=A0A0P8Y5A1_DROAN|nr:uncharacterized protein LOC26514282 [Drosophila ananassae]KPU74255.1 uncharacterized protein Dana_GF26873 [Drosophila ananassae]
MSTIYLRLVILVGVLISLSEAKNKKKKINVRDATTVSDAPTVSGDGASTVSADDEADGDSTVSGYAASTLSAVTAVTLPMMMVNYDKIGNIKGAFLLWFYTHKEWRMLDEYLWDHILDNRYWTSGTDNAYLNRKHYWFSTGKLIAMNIWHKGQPGNSGKEHCDEIGYEREASSSHRLNDEMCTEKKLFICRWDWPILQKEPAKRTL